MTEHKRQRATLRPPPKPAAGQPTTTVEPAPPTQKPFDPSKFGATTIPHELRLELLQMKRPSAPRARLYGYGIVPPGGKRPSDDTDDVLDSLFANQTTSDASSEVHEQAPSELQSADEQRAAEGHIDTLTGLPAPHPNAQPELAYASRAAFNEQRTILGLNAAPAQASVEAEPASSSTPTQPSRAAARARQRRQLASAALLFIGFGGVGAWLWFGGAQRRAPQQTVSAARISASSAAAQTVSVPAMARVANQSTSAATATPTLSAVRDGALPRATPIHLSHPKQKDLNSAATSAPPAVSSQPERETESKSWINVRD